MKQFGGFAAVLLFAACLCGAALAMADSAIGKRQDAMKSMAVAAKTIDEMFRGRRPYNASEFEAGSQAHRHTSRQGPA